MTRLRAALVALLAFAAVAAAAPVPAQGYATMVGSGTWRPSWNPNYQFPAPPGDSTPEFITRYVQLPADVQAGDVITVFGSEEFDNETHWTTYNTNFFGSCEHVRAASLAGPWSVVAPGYGENWDARQHHWGWTQAAPFVATSTTAGDYVGLRCWFARNIQTRDPDVDYVQTNATYGWIRATIVR